MSGSLVRAPDIFFFLLLFPFRTKNAGRNRVKIHTLLPCVTCLPHLSQRILQLLELVSPSLLKLLPIKILLMIVNCQLKIQQRIFIQNSFTFTKLRNSIRSQIEIVPDILGHFHFHQIYHHTLRKKNRKVWKLFRIILMDILRHFHFTVKAFATPILQQTWF